MEPEDGSARRLVARIRGIANTILLLGAITFLIAFATHWPPHLIAPVGLATLTAFVVSFFAIVIENRLPGAEEDAP